MDDLTKSIENYSRALTLTPKDHPDLSMRLAALGASYSFRFNRLGELGDLTKSIKYKSHAVELTHSDHPDFPKRLASLAASYDGRFRSLGDLSDLEMSMKYKSQALALTPNSHPDLPFRLAALGSSYTTRFNRLSELDDLTKSIELTARAVALTPDDHPALPSHLASLGLSHSERFKRLREIDDLEKSIEYNSRAVSLTPSEHPDLAGRHHILAFSCLYRYRNKRDPHDLQNSLYSLRAAAQLLTAAPRNRFKYALGWVSVASGESPLDSMGAYHTAIDLLPQFIWLGATTGQRYQDLLTTGDLAVQAASAAIASSAFEAALEWLEHARCIVWNQSLMLRSPLDELQSSYPDLATRLSSTAAQLHQVTSEPSEPPPPPTDIESDISGHRINLAREYNSLLASVRELPGFEDLLQPIKAKALIQSAHHGPVVVINCSKDRCDALLILPGQNDIKHVPLPDFTQEKARRMRSDIEASIESRGSRERRPFYQWESDGKDSMDIALAVLWSSVVKPVLDFLGYTNNNSAATRDLPSIIWCPVGVLSFLPLHAAGDYDKLGSRVFDYAISSYTPTLAALINSKVTLSSHAPRVLAIGQASTPGHAPLPGTSKELACVKTHAQSKAQYTELVDDQATTAAVLDAMEQHDWVHLACHAHQNVADATESGFFLHDGTLDLASINRRSFGRKGLAFLSACQTATGDEKLPDEAIHLASGMLVAGYQSVIATMWSVMDSDAPFVADKVYAELMKYGMIGSGEAGRALHNAVSSLREDVGEREFGRWVPYIHMGS
ncbi:unnamed protein product [Rhizoctonia solani]|uniref:CHAT domain-containing protein n=1 Tax=Rhizoctonia solani TaxID=456999 RepID=A0A8H3CMB5_9AGAM|nr:unnamed protein product [Rhizoctonia solani]